MKQFKESGYTINICTDIKEWAIEFYDLTEEVANSVANFDDLMSEYWGMSALDDREIWLFLHTFTHLQHLSDLSLKS